MEYCLCYSKKLYCQCFKRCSTKSRINNMTGKNLKKALSHKRIRNKKVWHISSILEAQVVNLGQNLMLPLPEIVQSKDFIQQNAIIQGCALISQK